MSTDHAFCTSEVIEIATGAAEARQLVDAIDAGRLTPDHAWLAFVTLQARHAKNSGQACRAFVIELAKRAAT
jgi:hypothetical protein